MPTGLRILTDIAKTGRDWAGKILVQSEALYLFFKEVSANCSQSNGTGWSRTTDLALRRRLLYPSELQSQLAVHAV